MRLGVAGGERFTIPHTPSGLPILLVDELLADLADAFFGGLERALNA